jgi:drug/metabolite transporter (DMT)-like permease
MKWTLLGILAVNLIFATLSDTAVKMWAVHPGQKWFLIAFFINVLTFTSFAYVIKEGGLAVGSTVALLLTIFTTVCIGFFFFKEQVTMMQWFGIGLGLFSIALVLGLIKA